MISSLTSTCIVLFCFFHAVTSSTRVRKPTIKHAISQNVENIGYLICEGKTSPDQTFTWEDGTGTRLSTGPELTVQRTNNPDETYICILRNLVSEERSDPIKEKDIFTTVKVSKPTIEVEHPKIAENIRYLTCEGKTSTDQILTCEDGAGTQLSTGPELTFHRTNNPDKTYICMLKNLASEERNVPIKEKDISPSGKKVYGVLGGQIEFKAIHETKEIKSIVWKFIRAGEIVKVVDWEPEYDMEEFGKFRSRVFLNIATGDLTVRDLTAHDTGRFVADINSKELPRSYDLVDVMARVRKPTIKLEISKNVESIGYLTCEGKTSPDQTFTWEAGNGTHLSTGPELTVHRTNNPDQAYICILKNLASEERSDLIKEKDIFPLGG